MDPKIGPTDDKNALKPPFLAVWSFQNVIGGFSIGIWEKSRNLGPPADAPMTLRSGRKKNEIQWTGVEKGDFGDAVFRLAHEHDLLEEKDLGRFESKSCYHVAFDPKAADAWARNASANIRRKIKLREYCALHGLRVEDMEAF